MSFTKEGKLAYSIPFFGQRIPPRADNRMPGHVYKEAISLRNFAMQAELVHLVHTERGEYIPGDGPVVEVPGVGVMSTEKVLALLYALGIPKKGERGT